MTAVLFLLLSLLCSTLVSTQTINLPMNSQLNTGTIPPGQTQTYSINLTSASRFTLTLWRTSKSSYNTAPQMTTVINGGGYNNYKSFVGKTSFNPIVTGAFNISITNSQSPSATLTFQIRACNGSSCPTIYDCSYTGGYCANNGACLNSLCFCDNTTLYSLNSYSCSLTNSTIPIADLFQSLFGLWIAVIVIGFILVCIVPIAVCVCCCGACAVGGAIAAAESTPINVHHHHAGPIMTPVQGVVYNQAEPQGQPGLYPQTQPGIYQQSQPGIYPQPQPGLYPQPGGYKQH